MFILFNNFWFRKEKPFQGLTGFGGGAAGLANAGIAAAPFNIEYLVIGGGGGGGSNNGGGGGAGGVRTNYTTGSAPGPSGSGGGGSVEPTLEVFTATSYSIIIGGGGRGGDKDSPNATSPSPYW